MGPYYATTQRGQYVERADATATNFMGQRAVLADLAQNACRWTRG